MASPAPAPALSEKVDRAARERARCLATGILGAGVVHEFANLLTVVDGLRQVAQLGIPFAEGEQLMRPSAARCHTIVEAFRHFFADRIESASPTFDLEVACLEVLLRARLRGRSTQLDFSGVERAASLDPRHAVALRLAFLCAVLALLEQARGGEGYPRRIEFRTLCDEGRCTGLAVRAIGLAASSDAGALESELLSAARALVEPLGGTVERAPAGDSLRIELAAAPELSAAR